MDDENVFGQRDLSLAHLRHQTATSEINTSTVPMPVLEYPLLFVATAGLESAFAREPPIRGHDSRLPGTTISFRHQLRGHNADHALVNHER